MKDIEQSILEAKKPGKVYCPECGEDLFSPMDKLSINLFGKCPMHIQQSQEQNLFEIVEKAF